MEEENRSAIINFVIIFLSGWIGPIQVINFFHMPNDGPLVGRTALISLTISILWLFFLKNEISLPSIIVAALLMSLIGTIFIGWIENAINGNFSFEVVTKDIIRRYWIHFLLIVSATILATKTGRKFLFKTLYNIAKWGVK